METRMPNDLANATPMPGYAPEEVAITEPTRSARLKWVVVVDESLPAGRMVNAVACISASTGEAVEGMIARGGADASGHEHPGLPWAGCTVLAASAEALAETRAKAVASEGVLVVDMPAAAQAHRVYADYLAELASIKPQDLDSCAISIVGPRNRVDKMVRKLALLA
jgi:hypothetical protein